MFDTVLELEWAKARAIGEPLSIILADIDFFKQYNDIYGHLQGDACLKQVAHALDQAASRTRDLCARFGGEEFVLILPATSEESALNVAERCRKLLARKEIRHTGSGVSRQVTISMGLGTVVPGANDDANSFLDMIDRRLYRAKAEGRDQVWNGES